MFHYHGAKYARLNKDDSVFGFEDSNSGSRWFCIFSVLLFYVPVTYVGMLNSCWVDKLSQKRTLTDFLSGLNKEWDKYSLLVRLLCTYSVHLLKYTTRPLSFWPRTWHSSLFPPSTMRAIATLIVTKTAHGLKPLSFSLYFPP